jgi:hypothetical protein
MQGTMPLPGASGGIQVTAGPEVSLRTAIDLAGGWSTLAYQERPVIPQWRDGHTKKSQSKKVQGGQETRQKPSKSD